MTVKLLLGDCRETLETLAPGSVASCITSPPYFGLRSYLDADDPLKSLEIGLEKSPEEYIAKMVDVFRAVRRVLADSGVLWLNLGDSYAGAGNGSNDHRQAGKHFRKGDSISLNADKYKGQKPGTIASLPAKNLLMIPFRVAMALQADGWVLRSVIPYVKRNAMPESVQGSHWSRHQVTIEEYERLSGLPYTGQRCDDSRTVYVPDLQTQPIPRSEATVSKKSEGSSDDSSTRTTSGREGETPSSQPVTTGANQQGEIRSNRKGTDNAREDDAQVQGIGPRQDATARIGRAAEVSPGLARTKEGSGSTLENVSQGPHIPSSNGTAKASCEVVAADKSSDDDRMASNPGSAPAQMLLLQEDADATNDGSRYSPEPGRGAPKRERGPSMPVVQFEEEQPADDALVDCPGCDQCRAHDGYIFHLSAGRPSTAVEYVFLLAKSPRYFYDSEAVRVGDRGTDHGRSVLHRPEPSGGLLAPHSGIRTPDGRNGTGRSFRNSDLFFQTWQGLLTDDDGDPLALIVNPTGYKGAHYAVFPEKLVEPLVKASTSEKGQCPDPDCGAPWRRVVEKGESDYARLKGERGWSDLQKQQAHRGADQSGRTGKHTLSENGTTPSLRAASARTTGWEPSCAHTDLTPVPQTVLDCFGGSGTVGQVADRLGRNAILCELKSDYAAQATTRVMSEAPMFTDLEGGVDGGSSEPITDKQAQTGNRTYTGFNARWNAKEASA